MASANGRNDTNTSDELRIEIPIPKEPALWWPDCCIYEVPQSLRKMNEKAYTPQLVSIGPIHHNDKILKPMQEQKQRYYGFFQRRLPNRLGLSDFIAYLAKEEQNIRKCYSKKYDDILKPEFVKMILLDAVFIMELFLRNKNESEKKNDILFSRLWIESGIRRDLALLENQLPMYVLLNLYHIYVNCHPLEQGQEIQSFQDLACHYFEDLNPPSLKASESMNVLKIYQPQNFTDFIRYRCLPAGHKEKIVEDVATARKLDEAGITFVRADKRPLLAIEFKKKDFLDKFPFLSLLPRTESVQSRLQIPQLTVEDNTEWILRNLIALEQCHYPMEDYICNYVTLLDCLIDTKEDVDFLVDKQIIVQQVGSNQDVATLFNKLLKDVCVSYGPVTDGRSITERLNKHYNKKWNRAMAKFKSVYFRDLWRGSLTMVGLFVFFFTLFNTIHTFLETILGYGFEFVIPMSLKGSIAF